MTHVFLSVLEISVSVSLIAAALLLLSPFLNRRYAAKWKYWIWVFLAFWLLIPAGGTDGQSIVDMLSKVKARTESEAEKSHADTMSDGAAAGRVIVEIPIQMTTPITVESGKSDISITLLDIAAVLWLTGCLIFAAVHAISYLYYKGRLMKRGLAVEDGCVPEMMLKLKHELRIRRTVPVIEASEAASPMIIGFVRPVLIMPREEYSAEELFFILKHELVHLRRGDIYVKLLLVAANSVHWFNPLIWLMQREAAVDMELACDEGVTQGADYTVRKAYTETLLSTLHRKCTGRTVLSTQFYGGTQIMKKRFRNILIKTRKKNGCGILLCAIILTVSLGALIGCSVTKQGTEDTEEVSDRPEDEAVLLEQMAGRWIIDFDVTDASLWGTGIAYGNRMELSETGELSYYIGIGVGGTGRCEERDGVITVEIQPYEEHSAEKEILTLSYGNEEGEEYILMDWHDEEVCWKREGTPPADNPAAGNDMLENTVTLTFHKEGEMEQKQAALTAGEGYSIYLPEGEWRQSDTDTWTAAVNEQVQLWTVQFHQSAAQAWEELSADGYERSEGDEIVKQEGEIIYKVRLHEFENVVWGVFYCYPAEAEEGWGRELPVIADTFAVSVQSTSLGPADRQGLKNIVDEFAAAYFAGDVDTIQAFFVI